MNSHPNAHYRGNDFAAIVSAIISFLISASVVCLQKQRIQWINDHQKFSSSMVMNGEYRIVQWLPATLCSGHEHRLTTAAGTASMVATILITFLFSMCRWRGQVCQLNLFKNGLTILGQQLYQTLFGHGFSADFWNYHNILSLYR
jgi:hypothetical protein